MQRAAALEKDDKIEGVHSVAASGGDTVVRIQLLSKVICMKLLRLRVFMSILGVFSPCIEVPTSNIMHLNRKACFLLLFLTFLVN